MYSRGWGANVAAAVIFFSSTEGGELKTFASLKRKSRPRSGPQPTSTVSPSWGQKVSGKTSLALATADSCCSAMSPAIAHPLP